MPVQQEDLVVALAAVGAEPGPAAAVASDLLRRWSEPHRRYHDLRHLREVLDRVDLLQAHADRPHLVRLAAWWHDAVHDGRAGADERASARLAEASLTGLGVAASVAAEVARLVLVTTDHRPVGPKDRDAEVLCDADLGILAAEPERYAGYAADVRQEYAHVPDDDFRTGRSTVLRRLLEQPRLFRTPTATAWEQQARANVTAELDRLGAARP